MSQSKRSVLSLDWNNPESRDVPIDDIPVVLDLVEVLLPCRKFKISYKVAETGAASLTAEFILRLLNAVDGMPESAIAEFFRFDRREMDFVMAEVTSRDYAVRTDGKVWLTSVGRALFKDGQKSPQIFSVEERERDVGFDLLSLCPQDWEFRDGFAFQLPELPIFDVKLASEASKEIPASFRRHFSEISTPRKGEPNDRLQSLYSIDSVLPDQRFSAIVPFFAQTTGGNLGAIEPNLSKWRNLQYLEDRVAIVDAAALYLEKHKISTRADDLLAYVQLIELAPEFLSDFVRRDGLAVERYLKAALTRAGDFRTDRPTVPLIGTLFTPEGNRRLMEAVEHALKQRQNGAQISPNLVWLVPEIRWGYTRALPALIALLKSRISISFEDEQGLSKMEAIAVLHEVASQNVKHIKMAFDNCLTLSESAIMPPSVEILLIPDVVTVALVHAPIKGNRAVPVPLGIVSFDPAVIKRAELIVKKVAPGIELWSELDASNVEV